MTSTTGQLSAALQSLVRRYQETLVGEGPDLWAFRLDRAAEPLRPAITADTVRHPLAQTRALLDHILGVYADSRAGHREKADVVRTVWGVDAHPVSVKKACEMNGLAGKARTAERWGEGVIKAEAVLDSLRPLARDVAAYTGPELLLDPNGALPPAMLERAARLVGAPVPRSKGLEQDVTAAVYDVAFGLMVKWYQRAGTQHLLHFQVHAYESWVETFPLPPGAAPLHAPQTPTGNEYPAAARAAWTICLDRALTEPGLGDDVLHRFERRRRAGALSTIDAAWGQVSPGPLRVPVTGWRPLRRPIVELLDERAREVRTLVREPGFPEAINVYLQTRETLLGLVKFQEERDGVALADQSVHWDTVPNEDPLLEWRVRRELGRLKVHGRPDLATHLWRAPAVLANKRNDWSAGHVYAMQGLLELYRRQSDGLITDPAEFMAAGEQLWLALAGNAVRRIEWHLGRTRTSSTYLAEHCRTALVASRKATDALTELDGAGVLDPDKGRGLPRRRGEGGRIDNRAWWARALLLRLRVGLAVHTAVQAGYVTRRDLFEAAPHGRLNQDRDLVEVAVLSRLYQALCALDTLTLDHTQELISLGLWLALVDGGKLPPIALGSPSIADRTAALLGTHGGEVSLGPLITTLRESGQDALVLSWLRQGGATFRILDKTSGGAYKDFRDAHDPYRPTTPSHD